MALRFYFFLCLLRYCVADDILDSLFGGSSKRLASTPLMPLSNLTAIVTGWTGSDVAVFYYSPYGDAGKFSRQVLPLWDEVYRWHQKKRTKKMIVAKFNCESSVAHQQLCFEVGVRHYPTLAFYGYSRLSFKKGFLRRSTEYRGLALADSIRDWTVAMRWLSWLQRSQDRFLCFLGLKKSPEAVEIEDLRSREHERQLEYERRLHDARIELAKAKAATAEGVQKTSEWDDLLANLRQDAAASSSETTKTTTKKNAAAAASSPKKNNNAAENNLAADKNNKKTPANDKQNKKKQPASA